MPEVDHAGITRHVIGAAIDVHRKLGPGLLESTYEACLAIELTKRGVAYDRQVALSLRYEDVVVEAAFRVDLLVERRVVVELKAVEEIANLHVAQLLTYMKASRCPVGLLINFNVARLKDGVRRVVLSPGLSPPAPPRSSAPPTCGSSPVE